MSVAGAAQNKDRDVAVSAGSHSYGGQAVIEGVVMRGRSSWGMAVRRPSGGIARVAYALEPPGSSHKLLRLPVVRGVVALYDSLSLGIRALGISANIGLEDPDAEDPAAEAARDPAGGTQVAGGVTPAAAAGAGEDRPFGWKEMAGTMAVALILAVGLFVVIPLVVVKTFEDTFANPFVFNVVEGIIRIVIFLLYILGISFIPDLRRIFMYHGAEHKVIHAYEVCGRPDVDEASRQSTLHPRCGTGFLLLVMVIAVFLFAIVGKPSLPLLVLSRIIGIPIIVGISYEIGIKGLGKHPDWLVSRFLLWPGLQLQRLTTREPTPDQLEVAAAALEEAMAMDRTAAQTVAPMPAPA
ncbi:MAG: DUF1385 domain-containing protein [Thermoleophilia bacterium]|jgi:uncharacterized protein YqhQ